MSPGPSTPTFLRFATELRLKIYTHYFSQTPLHYPAFHSVLIPLLLTSRQIYTEAAPLLPSATHYIFPNTTSLVAYLSSLPPPRLHSLRHITVTAAPFPLYMSDSCFYHTYTFPTVLRLFPGLQLDCLTLWDAYHLRPGGDEDPWRDDTTYHVLSALVARGKGWKELVYRSRSDRWITTVLRGEGDDDDDDDPVEGEGDVDGRGVSKVRQQPKGWRDRLRRRDGEGSGCEVKMWTFEAADPEARRGRVAWDVESRFVGGQHRGKGDGEEEEEEPELTFPEGMDSEGKRRQELARQERIKAKDAVGVEVRVRRGNGTDYVQDGVMEDEWERGLERLFEQFSWKEIQDQGLLVPAIEDDPCAHM